MLGMTVDELLTRMSSYEIIEWIAELKIRFNEQNNIRSKHEQLAKQKQRHLRKHR